MYHDSASLNRHGLDDGSTVLVLEVRVHVRRKSDVSRYKSVRGEIQAPRSPGKSILYDESDPTRVSYQCPDKGHLLNSHPGVVRIWDDSPCYCFDEDSRVQV